MQIRNNIDELMKEAANLSKEDTIIIEKQLQFILEKLLSTRIGEIGKKWHVTSLSQVCRKRESSCQNILYYKKSQSRSTVSQTFVINMDIEKSIIEW